MSLIKLSKLYKDLGVCRATIYSWKNKGLVTFEKSKSGRNFVSQETYNSLLNIKEHKDEHVIIYCRVSSSENKSNLQSQKDRLISYCNAKGYKVACVVEEIASGINDKRPKLIKILRDDNFTKIVVEHKDRLTRFGFNYIDVLLSLKGKSIEVVNNVETDQQDIIQDFVSIITSYCARIYGQRRSKRKTEQLIKELTK